MTVQYPQRRETHDQARERARELEERKNNLPEPIEVPLDGLRPTLNRAERRQVKFKKDQS